MTIIEKSLKSNFDSDLLGIALDPSVKPSLQAQLLEALRQIILRDPDRGGAQLPASRTLAAELSVSRTTVQAVYDQLISEGYLTAHQGRGTFVSDDLPHLSQPDPSPARDQRRVDPWRPFQTGLPDQALLPHRLWARHLERAWSSPEPGLLARPDPLGWYPLREAIADHLRAWRHLACDPEQVVITSGASESLEIVFRGVMDQGVSVAVEDPCWPKIHDILALTGAAMHPVPIDGEGVDAARIPPGASAVIVSPSRHFPTGLSLPLPRRTALIEWATRGGGIVIEDDYDSEFRYRGQPLPSLAGIDGLRHTIYLGSYSKLVSSALRIGFLVMPEPLLARARAYLANFGTRASLIPQPALASFMQSGAFAVHLRRMRRIYARRQSHLIDALAPVRDLLDIEADPAGMHLCLPLSAKLANRASDQEISAMAGQAGLQIGALSLHSFSARAPQALLMGYAAFEEDVLSDAAARLIGVLRRLA